VAAGDRARAPRGAAARAAAAAAGLLILACESTPLPPLLPAAESGVPERTLVVSVAGLGADALARDMPVAAALADAGAQALRVRSAAPAAAYPAHATLVTGVATGEHGVVADHLLGEHGVRAARYAHASHLKVATLWQRAVESGMSVASLDWPSTLGAAIPLLLPDAQALRAGVSWAELVRADTTPSLHALLHEHGGDRFGAERPGPQRDAVLTGIACDLLAADAPPRLLLLHLGQTAPALAQHGPGSAEATAAFRGADREIRLLLDCLARTGSLARSAVVVVGDHGMAPVHTEIAPNAALAREGLIDVSTTRPVSWLAISRSNGGSAFVYARDERSALRAREALARAGRETGAFQVVPAEELIRAGVDAEAWFGLEAEPGFRFSDTARAALVGPSVRRGDGGYLSERADLDTAFAAWGCGIRPGIRIPAMSQTDVAPTLARLLGVSLDGASGRVLVGVLAGGGRAPVAAGAGEAADSDAGR
jgi:predicted AlkP superfamily pyrophosphatase or phosphodiesterase